MGEGPGGAGAGGAHGRGQILDAGEMAGLVFPNAPVGTTHVLPSTDEETGSGAEGPASGHTARRPEAESHARPQTLCGVQSCLWKTGSSPSPVTGFRKLPWTFREPGRLASPTWWAPLQPPVSIYAITGSPQAMTEAGPGARWV